MSAGFCLIEKGKWDARLEIVQSAEDDATFLRDLSKWIVDLSGNANVAQRLNVISISKW